MKTLLLWFSLNRSSLYLSCIDSCGMQHLALGRCLLLVLLNLPDALSQNAHAQTVLDCDFASIRVQWNWHTMSIYVMTLLCNTVLETINSNCTSIPSKCGVVPRPNCAINQIMLVVNFQGSPTPWALRSLVNPAGENCGLNWAGCTVSDQTYLPALCWVTC